MAGDLLPVRLQRQMAGIEQVGFDIFEVTTVGQSPLGREDGVVPAPNDEGRWLVCSEELLECGIERDVRLVIVKQFPLNVLVAGTVEPYLVQPPCGGVQQRLVRDAVS